MRQSRRLILALGERELTPGVQDKPSERQQLGETSGQQCWPQEKCVAIAYYKNSVAFYSGNDSFRSEAVVGEEIQCSAHHI